MSARRHDVRGKSYNLVIPVKKSDIKKYANIACQTTWDLFTNEENNIPVRYFGETINLTSKGVSLPKLVQILVREVLNWQVKP